MLTAMKRDTKKFPLPMVAWAVEWGTVYDKKTGKPLVWPAGKQIVPLDEELKDFFDSRVYRNYVKERSKEYAYELDLEKYNRRKEQTKEGE